MTTDPTVAQLVSTGKGKVLLDMRTEEGTQAALGGLYPASSLYMDCAWVDAHKETVQKLANAFVKTLRLDQARTTPDEIAAKMPADYAGGDPQLYAKAVHDTIGMFNADGVMQADGAKNVLDVLSRSRRTSRARRPPSTCPRPTRRSSSSRSDRCPAARLEAGGRQRRRGQRGAASPRDGAEPAAAPSSPRAPATISSWRAADEVPPHHQLLLERLAAQQEQPGLGRHCAAAARSRPGAEVEQRARLEALPVDARRRRPSPATAYSKSGRADRARRAPVGHELDADQRVCTRGRRAHRRPLAPTRTVSAGTEVAAVGRSA